MNNETSPISVSDPLLKDDQIKELRNPEVSVVIPVYKAENCVNELYRRLKASLESITKNFEIILVEDYGGDQSWDKISEITQYDERVKGIQLIRNFGQHRAITAGLDYCRGNWVVVMDCDLQDRPEEIPRLYNKAKEGYDVVLARRMRRKDNALKRMTAWIFYKTFSYLTETNYDGRVGNFRIISRKAADSLRGMREQIRFFGALVDWMGFPTTSIEVEHANRHEGKTSYTYRKLIKFAMEIILAHSDKPLRLTVKFGFLMSLFAFVFGGYVIVKHLNVGTPIMGWSSLIVSLYFLSGIIIMILGMIGIYLGKTFDETKKRPLYIVGHKKNV